MDTQQAIEELYNILNDLPVTIEQKEAIEHVIKKLQTSHTKETLIEVVKLLGTLLGAGSKFFDP